MKYVCTVCGWSTESDKAPEKCPLCGATTFKAIGDGEKVYATEHKVGDGKVEDKEVYYPITDLFKSAKAFQFVPDRFYVFEARALENQSSLILIYKLKND